MTVFIALLRAVNVGGTGKLAMRDLVHLCESEGFQSVRTYIASGNVLFESDLAEAEVKAVLEARLLTHAGRAVDVVVRTGAEMDAVSAANPFPDAAPARTVALFLDAPPAPDALDAVSGRQGEELRLGLREIYVHYGAGMARSKLRIPAAREGTARNMNTVAKLACMARSLAGP
jgi:uncharacterized protein (DUF1697 family)